MLEIWISGVIPSKKNSKKIARLRNKPILLSSDKYLNWERSAIYEIKSQYTQRTIVKCESITYDFVFGDHRKRDLTNSVEGVNDALVSAGVLLDDNWKVTGAIILNPLGVDKNDCGVRIRFNGEVYE